jgi:hypothetical protein
MPIELAPPSLEESLAPRESVVSAPIVEASTKTPSVETTNVSSDQAGIEFIVAIIVMLVLYSFFRLLIALLPFIIGLGLLSLIGFYSLNPNFYFSRIT